MARRIQSLTVKRLWFTGAAAFLCLLVTSCGKPEAPQIAEWDIHSNIAGTELVHPKGWLINDEANVVRINPTYEIAQDFGPPINPEATKGVEIRFGAEKFKDLKIGTLAAYQETTKARFAEIQNTIDKEEPAVLAKQEAIKLVYHARIGPKSTIFGFRIIAAFDSSFYYFNYEAFNDDYEAYAKIVDSIVVSVKLPKPKVRSADPNEAAKPSPDVRTFSSEDIEIQHPDNFEPSFPKDKGKAIFAVSFMGPIRQDCFVTLGIFPSNKNKLDKIVEDNIKVFKSTGTTDAKIDGNDAKYLTVSPASGIKQRVYFAVKGDKMYRVIITWASSVEKDFLPSFEKMINSLKLK